MNTVLVTGGAGFLGEVEFVECGVRRVDIGHGDVESQTATGTSTSVSWRPVHASPATLGCAT